MDRLTSAFAVLNPSKPNVSDGDRRRNVDAARAKRTVADQTEGSTRDIDTRASKQSKDKSGLLSKTKASYQKRRQQIYEAQKRHRHRKEDHVKTLEAEIAELQRLTSVARSEKNRIALENQGIQELLVSCGAPVTTSSPKYNSDGLASINYAATQGPGTIDTLFDSSISTERVCVSHSQSPSSAPPSTGDSWLALDFILALEHPCRNHVQHPSATPPKTPKEANGHALTMTSAVYTRARRSKASVNQHSHAPPSHTQLSRASKERWQIPHSEVEKLIELAGKLDLDPVEMTPAQAYAAVLSNSGECNLQSILSYLKEALAPYANCFGFGAVLPSGVVWQELRAVLDHQ